MKFVEINQIAKYHIQIDLINVTNEKHIPKYNIYFINQCNDHLAY